MQNPKLGHLMGASILDSPYDSPPPNSTLFMQHTYLYVSCTSISNPIQHLVTNDSTQGGDCKQTLGGSSMGLDWVGSLPSHWPCAQQRHITKGRVGSHPTCELVVDPQQQLLLLPSHKP